MEGIKTYINTPGKLKKCIRLLDGFAMRYIPMFFIIGIVNGIVLKILFNQTVSNRFTPIMILVTAVIVSLLWTKLVTKSEISVFDHELTKFIKKRALSQ